VALSVGTGLTTSAGSLVVSYGTSSATACRGDDSRLSDARTPTAHAHGNITNAGAIGSTSNQIVVTTTSGVLTTAASVGWSQISSTPTTLSGYGITDGQKTITSGTADPTGGSNGDIYLKYTA
jgi:hypothetical protein